MRRPLRMEGETAGVECLDLGGQGLVVASTGAPEGKTACVASHPLLDRLPNSCHDPASPDAKTKPAIGTIEIELLSSIMPVLRGSRCVRTGRVCAVNVEGCE